MTPLTVVASLPRPLARRTKVKECVKTSHIKSSQVKSSQVKQDEKRLVRMRERRGRCKYLLHLQPSNYDLVEPFYPSFGHIGRSYHTKISKSLQQPMKGSTSLPSRTPLQIASPIWYSTGQSPPVFPNGADLVASCTTKRSSGS